jgi:FHS family L-fucose permease-like MFS transporter
MSPSHQSAGPVAGTSSSAPAYTRSLTLLASLFFMWGFITVINNTLLPHLRSVFQLNYTQTTIIESVWFIAYGVASIPSAWLIERIGYKKASSPACWSWRRARWGWCRRRACRPTISPWRRCS